MNKEEQTQIREKAESFLNHVMAQQIAQLKELSQRQISEDEWPNLKWNMVHAAKKPHIQAVYLWLNDGCSKKVQEYWEALDTSRKGRTVDDLLR